LITRARWYLWIVKLPLSGKTVARKIVFEKARPSLILAKTEAIVCNRL
jgi:hypothetical protein